MQNKHVRPFPALILAAAFFLSGCAVVQTDAPGLFDLGTARTVTTDSSLLKQQPPISVAEISIPAWLDTEWMFYRLHYANQQQPRPYATNRWAMSPGQLLAQRVKLHIAQAGGIALSAADGAANVPVLRLHVDDFSQHFRAPGMGSGRVAVRATVLRGRSVIGQKSFEAEVADPAANAAGGAHALAAASDAVLADLIAWLATLDLGPAQQ